MSFNGGLYNGLPLRLIYGWITRTYPLKNVK